MGDRIVASITEKNVPRNEAVIPTARALWDSPLSVMGYPSKQVAMDEEDPGMPIRTAEINEPDTPPIQIASNRINDVSVDSPNVTGRSSAIPSVAERPGIAPNTIPRHTIPNISRRLIGLRHIISCERYNAMIDFLLLFKQDARRELYLEADHEHGIKPDGYDNGY